MFLKCFAFSDTLLDEKKEETGILSTTYRYRKLISPVSSIHHSYIKASALQFEKQVFIALA